jgi:3-oxoadipate enol-lactonase
MRRPQSRPYHCGYERSLRPCLAPPIAPRQRGPILKRVLKLAHETVGDGPPLLLMQGLGYARGGWGPSVELLAERFRVTFYDNRGIGESDKPAGPYTTEQLAEDAVAVLDEVGVERAHVVGASLGGMAAQELALAQPERVDRLVLACTTPGGEHARPTPAPTVALFAEAPTLAPEDALRKFVANALSANAPDELVDEIYRWRLANPPDPAGWQAQAAAAAMHDAYDRLGDIGAPTLVVHGTEDNVVDAGNADLVAERIPDARLEVFEGCGHLLFWEQPERFARVVEEFLQ